MKLIFNPFYNYCSTSHKKKKLLDFVLKSSGNIGKYLRTKICFQLVHKQNIHTTFTFLNVLKSGFTKELS